MKLGFVEGSKLSNEQYHATKGFYSSSQMKDAIDDIEYFHAKYITGEIEGFKKSPALDIGTLVHTKILEPEKFDDECAVYTGKTRKGKVWDAFKLENEGKTIVTLKEYGEVESCIKAIDKSPITKDLFSQGEAELSVFTDDNGMRRKARADWINLVDGYIDDLKTTSGSVKDVYSIQQTISKWNYDLSAAYYLDTFNHYLDVLGKPLITDWYWTFLSKDRKQCGTYRATPEMLRLGRMKYKKGEENILKYSQLNWVFDDSISDIDPIIWDKQIWFEGKKDKKTFNNEKSRVVRDEDLL